VALRLIRGILEPKHLDGGEAIVEGVHPDGDPEVAGFFAGETEEEAEAKDVGDNGGGVLNVEDGPEEGGDEEGAPEAEAGEAPAAPKGTTEDEFFDKGRADANAEVEEKGDVGGARHLDHGIVGSIDTEAGGDEGENDTAADGSGAPGWPMPPFGAVVSEVAEAGVAGADLADEPTGGADEEEGGEGREADDVAIDADLRMKGGDEEADGHDGLPDGKEDDGPEEGPPGVPRGLFDRGEKGWGGGKLGRLVGVFRHESSWSLNAEHRTSNFEFLNAGLRGHLGEDRAVGKTGGVLGLGGQGSGHASSEWRIGRPGIGGGDVSSGENCGGAEGPGVLL